MEEGYWDERADNEEARALTVLYTTQNQKKEGVSFELKDIMQEWAWVHKGYDTAIQSKFMATKNRFEATREAQRELHSKQIQ